VLVIWVTSLWQINNNKKTEFPKELKCKIFAAILETSCHGAVMGGFILDYRVFILFAESFQSDCKS